MHKGVIILVKATDKADALYEVQTFLEPYGNGQVWDWYAIGGRWSSTLSPMYEEFTEWARPFLFEKQKQDEEFKEWKEHNFLAEKTVRNNEDTLQKRWRKMGMKGRHPLADHYKLSDEGGYYDVMPLKDCINTVKEWVRDLASVKEELWSKMIEAKMKSKEGEYDMSAYYAGQYYDADGGNFSFETNVYNAHTEEAEELPEDIEEYWAVMVDIHN